VRNKQIQWIVGAIAVLSIGAIVFGRVDSVSIDLLKGAFTLDRTSLVRAVDKLILSTPVAAEARVAQLVLIGDLALVDYDHPISDGLRQLERNGKGPWKYVDRDVAVFSSSDSQLTLDVAVVCEDSEFAAKSFVIFTSDQNAPFIGPLLGLRTVPCPAGREIVRIQTDEYRQLFGESAGSEPKLAKARRFALKPVTVMANQQVATRAPLEEITQ